MKKITAIVSAALVTAIAFAASAQSTGQVQLPPGYAICRTKALAPAAPPVNNIPECSMVDGVARSRIVKMQQDLAQVRGQVQRATVTADQAKESAAIANQRAAELEGRTNDLEINVANVQENAVAQQMDIVDHESRIQKLEKHAVTTDGRLDGVEERLSDMDDLFPKLTLRGGVAVFKGFGEGDSFAGFPVTLELALPVSPKYSLSFEGGATVSASDTPYGVVGRLGVEYKLSDDLRVGPGLAAYGVGLNSSLDSSVMFTGLDGRLTYRASDSFVLGCSVMPLGVDVAGTHDEKYAIGGYVFGGLAL
jgi:hypothetical protein